MTQLAVFLRPPITGRVKTRLIPAYGPAGAMRLHRKMALSVINTARHANLGPITLWAAEEPQHRFFRALNTRYGLPIRSQASGNLGERMHGALASHAHCGPTLLVGSDLPALTVGHLKSAAIALEDGADIVFLATEDGGFGLIGIRSIFPCSAFAGIPWGSSDVLALVRHRLTRFGFEVLVLGETYDVDRPEDVERCRWEGLLG